MSASSVQVAHGGIDGMIPKRDKQVTIAVTSYDCSWTERAQSSGTAFHDVSQQRA